MIEKKENNGVWKYYWTAGGMLKAVQRPDGSVITFKYDAFGRRISKKYLRREFLYIWDKNVPLHEVQKEELCEDNVITWIFEDFTPTAKLINGKAYSIISDHIGTPILAVDTNGVKVWERELDIYGKVRKEFTSDDVANRRSGFMPFLYAGQYYDKETELAYNRFRYYSPDIGAYISQDPIGLAGNNPNIYAYVFDSNTEVDIFGLDILYHYTNQSGMEGILQTKVIKPSLKELNPKDVRYGNGQYLSDIVPGTKTPSQLGRQFINVPNKHKYTHYVAIDVSGLDAIKGRDGVFVVRGDTDLDISDRIVSSGKIKCGG